MSSRSIADRVRNKRLQNINSTPVGGGVAEILTRMVPLLRELGVDATWDVIKGDQAFFNVTKAFHNALHGKPEQISEEMFECFRANTEMNLREMNFTGDVVWIHDPQPVGLIAARKELGRQWVWRCHIDISTPDPAGVGVSPTLCRAVRRPVFSMPDFAQTTARSRSL